MGNFWKFWKIWENHWSFETEKNQKNLENREKFKKRRYIFPPIKIKFSIKTFSLFSPSTLNSTNTVRYHNWIDAWLLPNFQSFFLPQSTVELTNCGEKNWIKKNLINRCVWKTLGVFPKSSATIFLSWNLILFISFNYGYSRMEENYERQKIDRNKINSS